jgi:hypothetical protein
VTLLDRNNAPITVGATAVVVKGGLCKGKVGTVRRVKESCATLRGKPGVMVAEGHPDDWDWAAWCLPGDITVVPAPTAIGGDA